MGMHNLRRTAPWWWQVVAILLGWLLAHGFATPAWGHADIEPRQSIPKRWETYTLKAPTETPSPTVKLHLLVPPAYEIEMVKHSRVWQVSTVRDERGYIRELTWSGGSIPPQTFEEFKFLARNPATPEMYNWDITQYYQDGEPGKWTAQTQIVASGSMGSQRAEEAWRSAQVATTVSLIAIGVALTLIILTLINIIQNGRRQVRDHDV